MDALPLVMHPSPVATPTNPARGICFGPLTIYGKLLAEVDNLAGLLPDIAGCCMSSCKCPTRTTSSLLIRVETESVSNGIDTARNGLQPSVRSPVLNHALCVLVSK